MLCKADHAYITYPMLQQQLSRLNRRKPDHRQFQTSNIFSVSLSFAQHQTELMSKSELLYDGQFTTNQLVLAPGHISYCRVDVSFAVK
jgi:hypothetical protein